MVFEIVILKMPLTKITNLAHHCINIVSKSKSEQVQVQVQGQQRMQEQQQQKDININNKERDLPLDTCSAGNPFCYLLM